MRALNALVAGLAVVLVSALNAPEANAAYAPEPGWMSPAYMAPVAPVCFETGGGRVLGPSIIAAAAGWNKADLTVVAKVSCKGYSRQATVKFVAYYNSATNARGYVTECATYASGTHTWTYLRGVWTWVANTPTVRVNYSPLAVKQCLNTTAKKTNMMSHETGHYFGLSHATGITVMGSAQSEVYTVATKYDILRINRRY
jgi:hypothetical protein